MFPSTDAQIYFSYLVAPYWSNIDTRLDGQVNYEVHVIGESDTSDEYIGRVSSLINSEQDPAFSGNWMIVATWDGVHPFPHGNSAEQDRVDPYLQSVRATSRNTSSMASSMCNYTCTRFLSAFQSLDTKDPNRILWLIESVETVDK